MDGMTAVLSKIKIIIAAAALLCLFSSSVFPRVDAPPASNLLPTLLLEGALDDAPQIVPHCSTLRLQFRVKNTGTVPVSRGLLTIDIKSANTDESVFARQIPFTTDTNSIMIENVAFPPGDYTIVLKASAMNQETGIFSEFSLAERPLTISVPVVVTKSSTAIPRVLLWLSRTGTAVEQAFAEKIVKQALDEDGVYAVIVNTAEDFRKWSLTGDFNTAVLFEPDELLDQSDWWMDRIKRGQGLVIIGSETRTRMIAETFGFRFSEALATAGTMLQLTKDSGLELSGSLPISGRILLPKKNNAKPAALLAGDKRPAMLIDEEGNGRLIVMPFSLTRSALDAGTTSLYSLLLRAAILNATSEIDEQSGVSSVALLVSAPAGPVRARVVETLPQGSRVIWTNAKGTVKDSSIIYDLTAEKEPQRLLFLWQPPAVNKTPSGTEVFYECNENLVSQGKIE